MTLAWSRHQYAELVRDQSVETWLGCHRRSFEHFNGVPGRVIIDNPKCAITKACYHDPQVQRAYAESAEGYGFLISPGGNRGTVYLIPTVRNRGTVYLIPTVLQKRAGLSEVRSLSKP